MEMSSVLDQTPFFCSFFNLKVEKTGRCWGIFWKSLLWPWLPLTLTIKQIRKECRHLCTPVREGAATDGDGQTCLMQRCVLNNRCPAGRRPLSSQCSEVNGLLHATVRTCRAAPGIFKVRKPLRPLGCPESANGCKEMDLSLPYFRLHSSSLSRKDLSWKVINWSGLHPGPTRTSRPHFLLSLGTSFI